MSSLFDPAAVLLWLMLVAALTGGVLLGLRPRKLHRHRPIRRRP
jgi:hypothetical protein